MRSAGVIRLAPGDMRISSLPPTRPSPPGLPGCLSSSPLRARSCLLSPFGDDHLPPCKEGLYQGRYERYGEGENRSRCGARSRRRQGQHRLLHYCARRLAAPKALANHLLHSKRLMRPKRRATGAAGAMRTTAQDCTGRCGKWSRGPREQRQQREHGSCTLHLLVNAAVSDETLWEFLVQFRVCRNPIYYNMCLGTRNS